MDVPETRYATTPDGVYIAYQIAGEGPVDVAWQFDFVGNSARVRRLCRERSSTSSGSQLTFEDAGERVLKGVPDRWHLYRVVSGSP